MDLSDTSSIHPSLLTRKIIHFDMDCFYAAVEMRDNPELKGKPLVVGGKPNGRGVVATASYEARKFGIRSAMACAHAYRLCPEAIFVKPNFEKYLAVSQSIREIFREFTKIIEPLSLDEAYLDVTENTENMYAVQIAIALRRRIREELDLTGSAGVAPNKLVAKIASDFHKPDGITVVTPDKVMGFMKDLSLRKIPGIGPATEKRLASKGLVFCRDIWNADQEYLSQNLGDRMANWISERARGIDMRSVKTQRIRKSLGKERTFFDDMTDRESMRNELIKLTHKTWESLEKRSAQAKTLTVKIKFNNFKSITRSHSVTSFFENLDEVSSLVAELLHQGLSSSPKPVRLLGVQFSNFISNAESTKAAIPSTSIFDGKE